MVSIARELTYTIYSFMSNFFISTVLAGATQDGGSFPGPAITANKAC
jgi:hypothetical protein